MVTCLNRVLSPPLNPSLLYLWGLEYKGSLTHCLLSMLTHHQPGTLEWTLINPLDTERVPPGSYATRGGRYNVRAYFGQTNERKHPWPLPLLWGQIRECKKTPFFAKFRVNFFFKLELWILFKRKCKLLKNILGISTKNGFLIISH